MAHSLDERYASAEAMLVDLRKAAPGKARRTWSLVLVASFVMLSVLAFLYPYRHYRLYCETRDLVGNATNHPGGIYDDFGKLKSPAEQLRAVWEYPQAIQRCKALVGAITRKTAADAVANTTRQAVKEIVDSNDAHGHLDSRLGHEIAEHKESLEKQIREVTDWIEQKKYSKVMELCDTTVKRIDSTISKAIDEQIACTRRIKEVETLWNQANTLARVEAVKDYSDILVKVDLVKKDHGAYLCEPHVSISERETQDYLERLDKLEKELNDKTKTLDQNSTGQIEQANDAYKKGVSSHQDAQEKVDQGQFNQAWLLAVKSDALLKKALTIRNDIPDRTVVVKPPPDRTVPVELPPTEKEEPKGICSGDERIDNYLIDKAKEYYEDWVGRQEEGVTGDYRSRINFYTDLLDDIKTDLAAAVLRRDDLHWLTGVPRYDSRIRVIVDGETFKTNYDLIKDEYEAWKENQSSTPTEGWLDELSTAVAEAKQTAEKEKTAGSTDVAGIARAIEDGREALADADMKRDTRYLNWAVLLLIQSEAHYQHSIALTGGVEAPSPSLADELRKAEREWEDIAPKWDKNEAYEGLPAKLRVKLGAWVDETIKNAEAYEENEELDKAIDLYRTACYINEPRLKISGGVGGSPIEFLLIPDGQFMMGIPKTSSGINDVSFPARIVDIGAAFYMGVCEITNSQFNAVMGLEGPNDEYPVELKVGLDVEDTWFKRAEEFCQRLSAMNPGKTIRLPYEHEWEYACRAYGGEPNEYKNVYEEGPSTGRLESFLRDLCWNRNVHQQASKSKVVGPKKRPAYAPGRNRMIITSNGWGLYDMHGNVSELCHQSPAEDAPGAYGFGKSDLVTKGGSYRSRSIWDCRSGVNRSLGESEVIGLRLVLEIEEKED